ncbi:Pentatricopeptide repeat-containing protein [Vitis vinifera]|uniref:Pentatricopeptide repeat-containing protein n=1 Tax=Vitis vinifera TaxID=29760 RepID=A0A438JZV8_VITVI|nr:Pentatricopeptide repeat-containing protein [Vitis vinifera]
MGVRFIPSHPTVRLSSLSLEKFLKSRKNLFKAPPRLWSDHGHGLPEEDDQPLPILKLSHPILRTLESCCGSTKEFNQIHTQLIVSGLLQQPLAAGRAVKTLCSFPDSVQHAVSLFEGLEEPDAFICNTIMRTYVNVNDPYTALGFYYEQMVRKCVAPQSLHLPSFGEVCGRIGDARAMFEVCSISDLVTWNSMIDGYVKNGEIAAARELFEEMPERDLFSWNSMIAGYVGNGDMTAAEDLFNKMPFRDIVSWNCMIDGYAQVQNMEIAYDGRDYANEATLVSVLTACAHLGRLDRGKWIHSYIKNNRVIEPDVLLSTALLTMYAKCGAMDLARDVFDKMPNRSVVSWNSMIMGYGMHGQADKALEMFLDMEKRGPMPNDATFICVLSACAHSGMILEGWWYFDLMRRVYKIEPKVEHYGCMVDLLGRAGLMKDSEELIRRMPMEGGTALWGALLSACRTHSNSELAEIVAKRLIELEPRDIGPYLLLSNIYAAEGKWDDVEIVRMMMKERGLTKQQGLAGFTLKSLGLNPLLKMLQRVHPTATYRVKNDTWPDSISKGAPKCVKNSGSLSCMSGSNMVAISLGSKHLSLLSNPAKKAGLHKPVQLGINPGQSSDLC